jgi:hypothetical protein
MVGGSPALPREEPPVSLLDDHRWHVSSFSGGTTCVEARRHGEGVQVRHSKDPQGAVLTFTPREWDAFVRGVKCGEFDIGGAEFDVATG